MPPWEKPCRTWHAWSCAAHLAPSLPAHRPFLAARSVWCLTQAVHAPYRAVFTPRYHHCHSASNVPVHLYTTCPDHGTEPRTGPSRSRSTRGARSSALLGDRLCSRQAGLSTAVSIGPPSTCIDHIHIPRDRRHPEHRSLDGRAALRGRLSQPAISVRWAHAQWMPGISHRLRPGHAHDLHTTPSLQCVYY